MGAVTATPATAFALQASPLTGNRRATCVATTPKAPRASARACSINDSRRIRHVRLAARDTLGESRVFRSQRRADVIPRTPGRDVRRRVGGVLGGEETDRDSKSVPSGSGGGGDDGSGENDVEGNKRLTPRQRMRFALKRIDSDGYWAVISSGIVFGTFLLESYNMSSFGGWDVLYRDDISWYTGLISMNALEDIEDAYNLLFFFEFCLRAWAFEFKKEFWTNPVTAVDFLATIPPVLSFFDIIYRGSPLFRFLRLLRVLRLLRLLDRSPNSVLFGLVRSDSMSIQLVGIGAEFICIFVIAAGVIYDLEYTVNPNVNNLNDTLYWAILTLTGIGQPFEVVTAGGRVATVLSIAVALIVVPGQLAKLATVAGAQDMMRNMARNDDEDSWDENDPMMSDDFEEVGTYSQKNAYANSTPIPIGGPNPGFGTPFGAFAPMTPQPARLLPQPPKKSPGNGKNTRSGDSAPPQATVSVDAVDGAGDVLDTAPSSTVAMRGKLWDGRECDQCGLQIHETDARFCRRCGEKLGQTVGPLYVKRETAGDTRSGGTKKVRKMRLPMTVKPPGGGTMGRIGLDITGATMNNFRESRNQDGGGGSSQERSKRSKKNRG